MKRLLLLFFAISLLACGGGDGPRPTVSPPPASVAPAEALTTAAPTSTAPAVVPTATIVTASRAVKATPKPLSPAPPPANSLPVLADRATLGLSILACAGEGLAVGGDGIVYTWGQRDGQPCTSAIDLGTGDVEPADPSALPAPQEDMLQVADPARGRFYVVENDDVITYDAAGQEISTALAVPPGEPAGYSTITALRLDQDAQRLYLHYRDFDEQAWIVRADLATGETIADVPVPAGPWALASGGQLLFANADTLVMLDGVTLEVRQRLSLSRRPSDAVVDPASRRLFVADAGGDVHVLDAGSLAEIERLPGLGASLDLDSHLGRLYAGDRFSGGVYVFDLVTLERLGWFPQPGRPVASPADGRVYIVEEGVYQADGATLKLLTRRSARNSGCIGCVYPGGVAVDPASGLAYTITFGDPAGKPDQISQVAVDPDNGRAFVARTTGGYQPVYSLALYADLSLERLARWVDGLYGQSLYNPSSGQLYLAHDGRLLVLDGDTLELLGGVDVGEGLALLTVDVQSGQLYAAQGEQLLRFEPQGAVLSAPAPEPVDGLPDPIYGFSVSPNFAQDATLFARATDVESGRSDLYRSRDGGRRWERVRGGLPGPANDLVFAPGGRLYAAMTGIGWRTAPEAAIWGQGVYVSDDGGDTWQSDNHGLAHLRVGWLHVASDGTLYALAASAVEPGHAASGPTIWKRLPGQNWALLAVPGAGPLRLEDFAIPAGYTTAVRAYWHELTGGGPLYQGWGDELRRSDDGGLTWRSAGRGPADYAEDVTKGSGGSVYWIGPEALWRSTDEGGTWVALRHPALDGPPFSMTVADVGGAETLFLGTQTGQVLVVPAAEAGWE